MGLAQVVFYGNMILSYIDIISMKVAGWEISGRTLNLGEMKVLFKRQLLYRSKMKLYTNVYRE